MNLTSGTKLGPYEIVSLLGAGGMGEVYRARDSRLKRDVAIKVLPQALSLDADRLRRFEQEALATAALNHPNILAVFDIGTNEGSPYVVSELLEGETLRERLRSGADRSCARLWTMPCKSRMDWPRLTKKESSIAT
jgi:serine/threonine protein kinase